MPLTPEEREFVKGVWERKKPWRVMTYLELERLYEWFLNRCREMGVDPAAVDFEMIVDSSLSYYENQGLLETKIVGLIPTPTEIEELEYYKRKVEELEAKIAELEKIVPIEEIEKLRSEIKKWKQRYEEARKTLERVKETPGLTEEDVIRIVRQELKEVGRALKPLFQFLAERIKMIEKRIAELAPPITIPYVPLRYKPVTEVESDIALIKEELPKLPIPPELKRRFEEELEKMERYKEELMPVGFTVPEERIRVRLRELIRASFDKMRLMVEIEFPMFIKKEVVEEFREKVYRLWGDMVRL